MKTSLFPCLAIIFGAVLTASGQMPTSPSHPHNLSLQGEPLGMGSIVNESVGTKDWSVSGEHANLKAKP